MATALASEALKARARQMCSEFTGLLAGMLADAAGKPVNPDADLMAALLVATWSVAFAEGYKMVVQHGDAAAAGRTFLRLIDQGSQAVAAAMAATPYAEGGA